MPAYAARTCRHLPREHGGTCRANMAAYAARACRRMPREHGGDRRRFPRTAEGGVRVLSVCRVGHRSAIDQEVRSFLAAQECGGFALLRTTMRSDSQCAQTSESRTEKFWIALQYLPTPAKASFVLRRT